MTHIVVINSGVHYSDGGIQDSITPDTIPVGVNVTFVDSSYDIVLSDKILTDKILKEERERISRWSQESVGSNTLAMIEGQPLPQQWSSQSINTRIVAMKYWRWIKHPYYTPPEEEKIIYIVCGHRSVQDQYEVMDRIEESLIKNRRYIWIDRRSSGRLDLSQYILQDVSESQDDFYVGEGQIPPRYLHIGMLFVHHMHQIEHKLKQPMEVPGWVFNTQTPFIRGIIERHGLKAIGYGANLNPPKDQPPQTLMLTSNIYRKALVRKVAQVLKRDYMNWPEEVRKYVAQIQRPR